jgi:hypothetical protein
MRKALNENPRVQIGVIVALLVGAAFMFLMGPLKKKEEPVPAGASGAGLAPTTGIAPSTDATSTAITATGGAVTTAPPVTSAASVPTTAGTVTPEALVPGPGLPAEVVSAWKAGDAIVLLIVKEGAVDDDLVRASVATLSSRANVSVFVAPASKVARYSRITQSVGVNRVPALVVVRPRSASGATPEGTVSYGFRDRQSVIQAVDDALYDGPDDVPYHPG